MCNLIFLLSINDSCVISIKRQVNHPLENQTKFTNESEW